MFCERAGAKQRRTCQGDGGFSTAVGLEPALVGPRLLSASLLAGRRLPSLSSERGESSTRAVGNEPRSYDFVLLQTLCAVLWLHLRWRQDDKTSKKKHRNHATYASERRGQPWPIDLRQRYAQLSQPTHFRQWLMARSQDGSNDGRL